MNKRENFTAYEILPKDLSIYLSHNGPHFNKKCCKFAVDCMYKTDDDGEQISINPYTKQEVDVMLEAHSVKIKNNKLYDAVYVANMCKADYLGSSIKTEDNVARFIKDTLDDPDGAEGLIFNRWIADMKWVGEPIPWEDFL